MDAEIQFFMRAEDESEFLAFARQNVDQIVSNATAYQLLLGDCQLHFIPSLIETNTIYAGRLEIRLGNADLSYDDLERAKSAFRKLRNWIKKHYFSRLAYKNKKGVLTPSRVHWLGLEAKKWKLTDPENHILKLSKTSWMEFDIGF